MLSLLGLLSTKKAEAELVPQDPEAATLLNAMLPAYEGVIRAAQADPQKANVYAGKLAEFLKDTTAGGFYQPSIGRIGTTSRSTTLPNTVMVGSASTDPEYMPRKWLGRKFPQGADPEGTRQQTLAHELAHFLISTHPGYTQTEYGADVLAANPSESDIDIMEQQGYGARRGKDYMIEFLRAILGQYSKTFMGPKLEPELGFRYNIPRRKK